MHQGAYAPRILGAVTTTVAAFLFACGGSKSDTILTATGGLEQAAFAGTPAVSRVELRVRSTTASERTVASTDVARRSLTLPPEVATGVGALVLAGFAADGSEVSYGRTPLLDLAAVSGVNGLAVLVTRLHEIVAASSLRTHTGRPTCSLFGAHYLLVATADSTALDIVDLLSYHAHTEDSALPSAPSNLAVAGSWVLTLSSPSGNGTLTDLDGGKQQAASAPSGTSFGDVLGGSTWVDAENAAFLVGPTRTDAPTDLVLRLDNTGNISARRLVAARRGAAVAYVASRGFVVLGGATSAGAPGVEVLATSATVGVALPFAADDVQGALAFPVDEASVARVRPDGSIETYDLACTTDCHSVMLPWKTAAVAPRVDDVAVPLESGGTLLLRGGRIEWIDRAMTSSTLLRESSPSLLAACRLPTGTVAIVGDSKVSVLR